MRAGTRAAALVLAAVLTSHSAQADPTGRYFYLLPFGGYTMFDGNLRFPSGTLRDQVDLGGRLGYQLNSWLGLEAAGGFTSSEEEFTSGQDVSFVHASGRVVLSPYGGRYGGPFILLGLGTTRLSPNQGGDLSRKAAEVGAGLTLWASDSWGLRLEGRDLLWRSADKITDIQNHILTFGAGITYTIGGKPRDTDRDGVADSRDECTDTPMGAVVDAKGCPIDSDGDQVFDGLDQCPGTPLGAIVDGKGCPSDPDGDGVFDGIDDCADTPKGATVDAKGCPKDSDGDGVLDGIDRCASTPQGATVDAFGCPSDGDGDGVFDGIDECPHTVPGLTVNAKGCSEAVNILENEFISTGKFVIQNLQFAAGKSEILPAAMPTLDLVGAFLLRWPGIKIEIAGYTDASGDATANERLSQARAQAVHDYLVQKFPNVKRENLSVKGYGPLRPVATNATVEGRSLNRRVEVRAVDPGALQQEIQRRNQPGQPQGGSQGK